MALPTTKREYRIPKTTGFGALTITEANVSPPQPHHVLLKVHAVSLQFRDLLVSKGQYPLGAKENVVPGSDAACEIIAVGDGVKNFKVGDRVSPNFALDHIYGVATDVLMSSALGAPIDGVLTEYVTVPEHSLVHFPEHLSYEEASTLPGAGVTAYNSLMGPEPLKGGDVVLVEGSGGVSVFGLQFAHASGATVIATTSSEEKAEQLKKLGADYVINYKTHPDWEKEVLKFTGGRGVDHVIEVGGAGTLMKAFESTRYGGWIHTIGFVAGMGDGGNVAIQCLVKAITLRGILVGSRQQFEDMNRLVAAKKLKPAVDKVFPFEELQQAYEYLDSQKHVGKVVIKVSKD